MPGCFDLDATATDVNEIDRPQRRQLNSISKTSKQDRFIRSSRMCGKASRRKSFWM